MANSAEMTKIIRACRQQGLVVPSWKDGTGHYLVYNAGVTFGDNRKPLPPEGGSVTCVRISSTPCRDTSVRNDIARLRRLLGFEWNGH